MTRWLLTAGIVAVLTVVVRFGRIVELLVTPSPETQALPSCWAKAIPISSASHSSILTAESSSSVWVADGMA